MPCLREAYPPDCARAETGGLTMAEYIELEVAVKAFNNFDAGRADSPSFTLLRPEEFAEYLYELPTADVAPVVHGLWEKEPSSFWRWTPSGAVAVARTTYRCGLCGRGTAVKSNYCPNCGAKMDGGADHEA